MSDLDMLFLDTRKFHTARHGNHHTNLIKPVKEGYHVKRLQDSLEFEQLLGLDLMSTSKRENKKADKILSSLQRVKYPNLQSKQTKIYEKRRMGCVTYSPLEKSLTSSILKPSLDVPLGSPKKKLEKALTNMRKKKNARDALASKLVVKTWSRTITSSEKQSNRDINISDVILSKARAKFKSQRQSAVAPEVTGNLLDLNALKRAIEEEKDRVLIEDDQNITTGRAIATAALTQEPNPDFVDEHTTGMPVADVHNYSLYCQSQKFTVMLRPVADGAAQAFIGIFGFSDKTLLDERGYPILEQLNYIPWSHYVQCTTHTSTARGKTMATALKSSPYEPIKGMVPVHAQLSKVGAAHTQLLNNLEAALIEAGETGDESVQGMTSAELTKVYARLKTIESRAAEMFLKIQQDSENAVLRSKQTLERLNIAYNSMSMPCIDKHKISELFVDEFNNSQILGECFARFGPVREIIHFLVGKEGTSRESTVYQENNLPVFLLLPTSVNRYYRKWETAKQCFVDQVKNDFPPEETAAIAVKLVASRKFYVSKQTGRIEEYKEGCELVPDYDGLTYARDFECKLGAHELRDMTCDQIRSHLVKQHEKLMCESMEQRYIENMGLVTRTDEDHIQEVRVLTDWRQSHGEESNNTIKTQDFLSGNYSCFDSDGKLRVVKNFEQAITFIRQGWQSGKPLQLNPNWNVLLDQSWLPYVGSESIKPLYNKEERDASIVTGIRSQKNQEWDEDSLSNAYSRIYRKDGIESWRGMPRTADGKKATELELWRTYVRFRDEWKVIQLFFQARRALLFPVLFLHKRCKDDLPCFLLDKLNSAEEDARRICRRSQSAIVLKVVRNLTHQKDLFAEKHGVSSTSFIDHIWEYLMVYEIRNGFSDFATSRVESMRSAMITKEKSVSDVSSANQFLDSSKTRSNDTGDKHMTSGEMVAVDFMRRHGQRFLGLNPWVDSTDPFANHQRTRRCSRSAEQSSTTRIRPAVLYEHRTSLATDDSPRGRSPGLM